MKVLSVLFSIILVALSFSCTKKTAKNTALAFSDPAIFDSCSRPNRSYYKNDPVTLLSGAAGPHGNFKLRFNAIAFNALTQNGKLPAGKQMPDGGLIIKDIYQGGNVALYAYMYKVSGTWLWGEIKTNGQVLYSVNMDPGVCVDCHRQAGNRDLLLSFNFY